MSDATTIRGFTYEHTPGPWKVVREPNEMPGIFTEKNEPICDVYEHGAPGGQYNARLIAAAPELLAALELIDIDSLPDDVAIYASAAITKATGAK